MTDQKAKDTGASAETTLLRSVTPTQVAEAIKASGCSVTTTEQNGVTQVHSASQGIAFQVLWGNAIEKNQYVDFTLCCPLRVQGGTLPESLLQEWHANRRFARVARHGEFLVLEMDVLIGGGVSSEHLTFAIQLWSQMMGQFFVFLRNFRQEDAQQTEKQHNKVEEPTEA